MSPAEYLWREWRLGEGRFKGRGPKSKPRPTELPTRIPILWFVRLGAFLARRKTIPQSVSLGPFAQHGALYRAYNGGVEDVDAAKAAGVSWALLCLDSTPSDWDKVLTPKLNSRGIPYGYWFHCRTVWDLEWLLERSAGRPIVGINVEKELETTLSPQVIVDTVRKSGYKGQVATVLLGWVPNSVDCRPIGNWPALLEIMPQDAPTLWPPMLKVHQAFEHAKIQGLKAPLQLMGCQPLSALSAQRILDETGFTVTPGLAMPAWYDRFIPGTAVYTTDDVEPRWDQWSWT